MVATLETGHNLGRDAIRDSVKELEQEVLESNKKSSEEEQKSSEKKEKSFTFKPIAASLAGSQIKNGETWANNLTTNIEFAGGGKNLSLYGYTRKDWSKYSKGFNEGIEIFANENLKLGNNFDLNGKQFYWGKGSAKLMLGPKVSKNVQIGNVGVGGSLGAYGTYDVVPDVKDSFSGTGAVSVNFSVEQKNGKTWNGNAFLNVNGIKDFDHNNYTTYGEAEVESPTFLDPEIGGALCGFLYARYGGTLKEINLMYLGAGIKYKF